MILTGPEIHRQVRAGQISIVPFAQEQLNPNSYNYRLGPLVLALDAEGVPERWVHDLRDGPLVLRSRRTYLAHTAELIGSRRFVTMLNGRSSVGRLGMYLNFSADLGQMGPAHHWTLEITVVQPLRVHFGMLVGQATFWLPWGPIVEYVGEYAKRSEPTPNLDRNARCR
jgi:dCTP deaminase